MATLERPRIVLASPDKVVLSSLDHDLTCDAAENVIAASWPELVRILEDRKCTAQALFIDPDTTPRAWQRGDVMKGKHPQSLVCFTPVGGSFSISDVPPDSAMTVRSDRQRDVRELAIHGTPIKHWDGLYVGTNSLKYRMQRLVGSGFARIFGSQRVRPYSTVPETANGRISTAGAIGRPASSESVSS